MLGHSGFDDNRGRYPEPVKIQAERGTRAALRQAAARESVSIGEFVRKAIGERIAGLTRAAEPGPPPHLHSAVERDGAN